MRVYCLIPLLLVLSAATALADETYRFVFNRQEVAQEAQSPTVTETGISLAGVRVRTFDTCFSDPLGEAEAGQPPSCLPGKAKPFASKLNAEQLGQLDFYGIPELGTIAVPQGWRFVDGRIGVNGSMLLLFLPPAGDGYVLFFHDSACAGCALGDAVLFFPREVKRVQEAGLDNYKKPKTNLPVQQVNLNPRQVAYRVESGKKRLDGVAYFDPDMNENALPYFWRAEVCLPPDLRTLATPILNRFISIYTYQNRKETGSP